MERQMSFLDFVGGEKEIKIFLCGKCCFYLNMTLEERMAMSRRLKQDSSNVCDRCGFDVFTHRKTINLSRAMYDKTHVKITM